MYLTYQNQVMLFDPRAEQEERERKHILTEPVDICFILLRFASLFALLFIPYAMGQNEIIETASCDGNPREVNLFETIRRLSKLM
jgi:hypothetical protein